MAPVNRAELLTKIHRLLKKHFKPFAPDPKRSLLEHLLFACCLENAAPEQAELVYNGFKEKFFDLNEVRVSTVRELAEFMQSLPDAPGAASRVKGVLQGVFEDTYSFDLEPLKKQNLGQAIKRLEKLEGATPFSIAYITQAGLGGHAIPINQGALQSLVVLGVVSEADAAKNHVPGLERAIAKNKGVEFGSLLHQLGLVMSANPYGPAIRNLLLEIDPDCKDRLPKRIVKKEKPAPPAPKPEPVVEVKTVEPKSKTKKPAPPPAPSKATAPPKKKVASRKEVLADKKKKPADKKKSTAAAKNAKKVAPAAKKTTTKRLAKRKPR